MIELAISAAKEAGAILLENFGKVRQVQRKGERELVSNVDVESENKIIQMIRSRYPDHSILCEESEIRTSNSEYKWIIDPLDGTHNYVYGINIFGVSIALEHRREIILGVINLPATGEIYWAERGKGAYLNGERIFVSEREMNKAFTIFDSGLQVDTLRRVNFLSELVKKVFNIRMFGASTRHLTYIARGSADLMVEFGDNPWDFAAGGLILMEAGGKITTLNGQEWNIYERGYVASNGKFHDEVIKLLSPFL